MSGQRIVLHIGLHKTGTTYLQRVLRANRDTLAARGVHAPGDKVRPNRTFAVYDLFGRRPRGSGDDRIAGQWEAMTTALLDTSAPVALLSEEALSLASPSQARRAVRSFPGREVHALVTARDLARVALSAWQEDVKTDETWTWRAYADSLADPAARARSPARGFWLRQDLPAILAVWASVLPVERVHVVTTPQPGAPPDLLLARFASVVGFDTDALDSDVGWANTSLGVAGTEVLRRANLRLHRRLTQRQYHDTVETVLAPLIAHANGEERMRLPEIDEAWVRRAATQMIEAVSAAGYPVEGDLADLRPRFDTGVRHPGEAQADELLEVAIAALAGLTERFAIAKWDRRRPQPAAVIGLGARTASTARSLAFRAKRAGVGLADSHPIVERSLRRFLSTRGTWLRSRSVTHR